ncbi:Regulator of G-protein signaling 12 [Lamellibrachia satsuma]|nr:Regulator of G-protein signaling 12 [Lamellibrachia satsuma]
MHNHRRRKKQPHAMRSIELLRSRAGYGFTISGQQPCVLSCIVTGSPADCAGLKTGDYLMVVNGLNVSNASHDDVVRLIGSSLERLDLEIAENYNSSDSSEEDFQIRPKSKYPNRRGRRTQGRKEHQYVDGTDLDNGALGVADRYSRLGGLHPEMGDANEGQDVRSHWQRVEQVEHRLGPSVAPLKYRGQQRPKHTIITRETRLGIAKTQDVEVESGPRVATASITSLRPSQDAFVPVHTSSQVERPTVGRRRQVNTLTLDNIRAMVGYVGSIEMPALARPPSWRTQSLKGAVRRLRIEQKMHTSVLMHINCDGVHLLNAPGKTIAHYPADNIVSCGVCPDDKRFFGLMTLHRSDANCDGTQSNILLGSSCHVFSIDPQLNRHSTHVQKAHSFNIQCTMNPTTNCCAEFPPSTTLILQTISRLCCNLEDALEDAAMAHVELSEESAAAANSDAYRGGNYTQRSRPDTHVQPHSKRSRPAETQRSVSQVQMALQKALPVTRHPFDTDGARFRQPSTQYQSTSMLPPPLPAKHTQGAFRKTTRAALPVAPRVPVPVGMVMVSTPQSHPASRIAKFSRPKSTPPFMTDDHWEVDVFVDAADYESDPGDSCATGRSDASVASATLPRPRRSRHFGNDVGVINEKSAAKSLKQLDSDIVSENSKTGGAQQCVTPPAGCATSWAVNFNNLLSDKSGLAAFTDFLKKEFSEENIKFWSRCEHYKQIEEKRTNEMMNR